MKRLLVIFVCLLTLPLFMVQGQELDSLTQAFRTKPSVATATQLVEQATERGRRDLAVSAYEYLAHQNGKYLPALWESYLRELRLDELSASLEKQSRARKAHHATDLYAERLHALRRLMGNVLWLEVADTVTIAREQLANYLNGQGVKVFSCDSLGLGFLTERSDRYIRPLRERPEAPVRLVYGDLLANQPIPTTLQADATIITAIPDSLEAPSYPTLAPDGITLYFSAISKHGLGGRDLYMTRQTASGGYLQPVPLGLPYNSTGDDLLIAFNAERHLGYLVSDRYAPHGMVTVYRFVYTDGEVTEVPSNDPALLRQYAMLRPYRITQRADVDYSALLSQQTTAQPAHSNTSQGAFVVAPNVIYTSREQFHSAEAATLYDQYLIQQKQLTEQEQTLARLRTAYHQHSGSDADLTEMILQLERELPAARKALRALAQEIRQLERPHL